MLPANPLLRWIKNLAEKLLGSSSRRTRRHHAGAARLRGPIRWRPMFEQLEDRVVPTIWTVSVATDAAAASATAGMLRYAVINSVAGDTIVFAPSLSASTITLSGGALTIAHNLTIIGLDGGGSTGPIISGTATAGTPVFIVSAGVTASISGVTVTNGLSSSGAGIRNLGTLSLSNDLITGNGSSTNTGTHSGAGIYSSGTMFIDGCTITNNSNYWNGGGIYNTGTMTVIDSTIVANYAYTDGGGIDNTGTLTLANDTIAGNAGYGGTASFPEYGGGIYTTGTVNMVNTIVAGDVTTGAGVDIYGTIASATNSLIGNTSGATITSSTNNQTGVASGLGSLAANGGPTKTEVPGTTSVAIGHGTAITTVPAAGIAATGNFVTVTNGAFIGNAAVTAATPVLIRIDSEQMLVTAVSGNALTVIRGYNGTTAAAHASGAGVFLSLDQRGYAISSTLTTPDIGAYQSTGTAPATPTVTGVNPILGSLTGGTSVTITGTNLQNATSVSFGGAPGTIVSDSGTSIVATTPAESHGVFDTVVTTAGWDNSATSAADQILFGPLYADALASGVLTITEEFPTFASNLQLSLSGGNYILTDANGATFDVATGANASSIAGTGTSTITIPSSAVTSISIVQGTGTNAFTFNGTGGATAAPITVNDGTAAADQLKIAGAVIDSGAVSLTAGAISLTASLNAGTNAITLSSATSITQATGAVLTGGLLTTSSATGTVLNAATNVVTGFNATNTGSGFVNLLDSTPTLGVTGITNTTALGAVTVSDTTGAIAISGAINAGSNPIGLSATAITQSAGIITGGLLSTTSATGTTLNGATNAVTGFTASNTGVGAINLLDAAAPLIVNGISDATTGGPVTVSNTGSLLLVGAINGGANAINLTATGGTITQVSGVITGGLLTTSSAGGATLNGATNAVTGFNATNSGAGAVTLLDSTATLTVTGITDSTAGGSVTVTDSGGGINVTGPINAGSNAINLTGATITQTAAGVITGGLLTTSSATGTTLGTATNVVTSFSAVNSGVGAVNLLDSSGTLTVTGISDTTAASGPVTVNNSGGALSLTGAVNAGGNAVNLTSTSTITQEPAGVITGGLLTTSSATGTTLSGATNAVTSFNGSNSGIGAIILLDSIGTLAVAGLADTTAGGPVTITDSSGAINITGAVGVGANAINLNATSAITQTAAGVITGGLLTTSSATGAALGTATNAVTGFSASNSGAGAVNLLDSTATLTVAGINDSTAGGSVTVNNSSGAVNVTGGINAGSNAVNLTSGTSIAQTPAGVITGGLLTTSSFSGTTLAGTTNAVGSFNGTNTGPGAVTLLDSGSVLIVSGISDTTFGGPVSVTNSGGAMNLAGALNAGSNAVNLTASTTIGQTAAAIITGGTLTTSSAVGATLNTATNAVTSFNASNSSIGAVNLLDSTATLTVAGIADAGGAVTVNNSGGAINVTGAINAGTSAVSLTGSTTITQAAAGVITGGVLTTSSATGTTLANAINAVTGFNAANSGVGAVTLFDSTTTPLTVTGISDTTAAGGPVSVTNLGGGISLTGALNAGSNAVNLTAASTITQAAAGIITGGLLTTSSGTGTTLNSATNAVTSFNGSNSGVGAVNLLDSTATLAVSGISDTAAGGPVTVNNSGGAISVTGPISAGANAVNLTATTTIGQSATGAIAGGLLTTSSATGTTLTAATNVVTSFNASNTGVGAVTLLDSTPSLAVTGITDTTTAGGPVTVSNTGGALGLTGAVNAGSNAVNLTAASTITQAAAGVITGGLLTTSSATGTALSGATNAVTSFSAANTGVGPVNLLDSTATLTVSGVSDLTAGGPVTVTNSGGAVNLTGAVNVGANAVSLTATSTISQVAAGVITGGLLTTSSATGATLGGATNAVTSFNATNSGVGAVNLLDSAATLTVTGITDTTAGGPVTVSDSGGVLSLTGALSAGTNAVNLTGASIGQTAAGVITGGLLTTSSATGTALNGATNAVTSFNASNSGVGAVYLLDSTATLAVAGITDITAAGGPVTVTDSSGALSLTGAVNAGANAVNLTSSTTITQAAAGGITGGLLTTSSATGTTLNTATNAVTSFNATNSGIGAVNLLDATSTLTITGINDTTTGGPVSVSNTGGAISITGPIKAGSNAVNLTGSSTVAQAAAGVISGGLLTTSSATGTTLNSATNAVTGFNATNSGVGAVNLLDSIATLTVTGITDTMAAGGPVTVNNSGGALSLTGAVNAGSNAVNLTAATALTQTATPVVTAGALSINAGSIGTSGQSLVFNAASVTANTAGAPNGNQFLADNGTVALTVANALNAGTGTVTLTGGTFQVQAASAIPSTVSVTVNSPAILDLDGHSETIAALNGTGTVTDSAAAATLTVTGGGAFSGSMTGANTALTVAGAGQTLTLSGAAGNNTYGGATTIQMGTLQLGAINTLPTTAALNFGSSASNGTLDLNGFNQTVGTIAVASGAAASGQVIGNSSTAANATLTVSASSTFGGTIEDALGSGTKKTALAFTGGTLVLTGSNTYTGGTLIQAGTLQLGNASTLAPTGTVTFGAAATNGTLDLNGFNQTVGGLFVAASVPLASAGNQTIGDSNTTAGSILTVNGTSSFAGTIKDILGSGTQRVTLDVTGGTLTLSGANTYSGGTNIIGGTLQIGASTAVPAATTVTFGSATSSGILDLDGSSPTVAGLAVASGAAAASQLIGNSSTTAPATLTFTTGTSTFGGTIENVLGGGNKTTGLIVAGGSLKLTGTDTYTGATQVSAGQLLVDGSIASAVAVSGSGILAGTGTVGAITGSGGTVDPGDPVATPAILTAASADFSGGGDLTLGIAAFSTAGSGYDKLNLGTGALTLGGTSALTLNLAGLATSGTVANIISYGSYSGAFSTVNLINNPNNFQAVLTYTATGLNVSIVSAATHFQVTGLSGSVGAGTPLSVTVTALDAYNNVALLYTGTVHFTTTDPSTQAVVPGNYTFTTGDNGAHTFTGLTTLVTLGSQTVTATDTLTGTITGTSGAVTITSAAVTHLAITTQPANAFAGVAISPAVVVKIEDQYGNVVTTDNSSSLSIAANGPGGFTGTSTTTLIVSAGVATFSNLVLDTAGSNYTLTVTDTTTSATLNSNSFVVAPNTATQLAFTTQPSNATAGAPIGPVVKVSIEDAYGNVETSNNTTSVTIAVNSGPVGGVFATGSTTTAVVNGGVATFATLILDTAGSYTLKASAPTLSLTSPASSTFTIAAAAASQLVVTTQPSGTATAGINFAIQPVVAEEDQFGNVVITDSANSVTVARGLGTAGLQGGLLTATLSSGVATFSGLSYDKAETMNLAFSTTAGSFTATSNSIVVSPAGATQLVVTQQPASAATAGIAFTTQPVVKEEDQFGNVITSDSAHTVTAVRGSVGTATLQGGALTTVTLSSGVATFSGLFYDKAETMNLAFSTTAGGFTIASNDTVVSPAGASQLAILQQPSSTATAGLAFAAQPVVAEEDPYGNVIASDSTHTITAASTGSAALQGTATLTLIGGEAAFSGLSYNKAETMSLGFSTSAGPFTATSNNITVSPAAASQLVITQQPSSTATAGVAFAIQPVVKEEDPFGNVVISDSTHTVTAASTGTAALQGAATLTLTNGVATFSGLTYDKAENIDLGFSTNAGAFTATSSGVAVSPAALDHFKVTGTPTTVVAGVSSSFTVTAQDFYGNTVTSFAGAVTFSSTDTNAQTALPAPSTLTNGVGAFSATLTLAGSQTITATDTTYTGTSSPIVVTPAALNHFAVISTPASSVAGSGFLFAVKAQDLYDNTVTSYAGTVGFTTTDSNAQSTLPGPSTLTNGAASFVAALDQAGAQTITATDTVLTSITGTSSSIVVTPAAAKRFVVIAPASATAGAAFTFSVTALDFYGNTATGYTGLVHFSTTDTNAQTSLPANSSLTNGFGSFSAALTLAGTQTITATDTVASLINGTSNAIVVHAASATHFVLGAPTLATAGTAFVFTVTAQDQFNNTAVGYAGTVHFSSTDTNTQTVLPGATTLSAGVGTFSVTLTKAGSQTITAADVPSSISQTTSAILVLAGAANHYLVVAPSAVTGDVPFAYSLTVQDAYDNVVPGYTGTVHFTSSDSQAVLPADTTISNGVATFDATLKTTGLATITATDTALSTITGTTGTIIVTPAALHFVISAPTAEVAGNNFSFTVSTFDASNNPFAFYTGTVHFTSTSGTATLPANATLINGVGTFSAALDTVGAQSLVATDTVNSSITGSAAVTVSPAAAAHYAISVPPTATAGVGFTATVMAEDQFNNIATGYTGTVHFTSSDGSATLPADSTLTNGVGSFNVTLKTVGAQTLTATDTVSSSVHGTSSATAVHASTATHYLVSTPSIVTAGTAATFTVSALDQFNNVATGYTGTVSFSSSDGLAILPANSTLTNGVGTFSFTLGTAGLQTLTATDTAAPGITGTQSGILVTAGAFTHFAVAVPSSTTAGVAFNFTVTAQDAFNNTVTGYAGTVQFSSSDGAATLPATSTLTNGVGTFGATLRTEGSLTLTATDPANTAIFTTSAPIVVNAASVTHLALGVAGTATAGGAFTYTVTAEDAFNNTVSGYAGTVHFSSSDGLASVPADSVLSHGVGTFSATLRTSGNQTLHANDVSTPALGGSSTIAVQASTATHFALSTPTNATAGSSFTFTVTALDQFNNTATGYTGTVQFSSSDINSQTSLPAPSTLSNGTGTFVATLTKFGSQTLTATDTAASITDTNTIAVAAAAVAKFAITGTPTGNVIAGSAFTFTVTALDPYNNVANYTGLVHFTSTDTNTHTSLPIDSTLTAGTGAFSATLTTAGTQTITATDTTAASVFGTSAALQVIPIPAATLVVSVPVNVTAGVPFTVTVTADDQYGNLATGYAGTIHFASSDIHATLPGNYAFAPSDAGVHSFTVTLATLGNRTLTVADTLASALTATKSLVVSGAATHYTITGVPSTTSAGTNMTFTVTALDSLNDTAIGYTGTVHFTSNDPAASLPVAATLTNGAGTFTAAFKTAGVGKTITATDGTIKTTTAGTTVAAGLTSQFFFTTLPANAAQNTAFNIVVKAQDQYGNATTPTVHFSSTSSGTLPANTTLLAAGSTFSVKLATLGAQTITATDANNPTTSTTSNPITVYGAATQFVIQTTSTSVTAGKAVTYKVTAEDSNGDTALGYRGTVHFTASGDPLAILPANYAFTTADSGVHTFTTVTYRTAGTPTLTATDTVSGTTTGQNSSVTVNPAAATKFTLTPTSSTSVTAGNSVTYNVTAYDAYGNIATGFTGNVAFTSSDPKAVLPVSQPLTNGVGSFSASFETAGVQSILASSSGVTGALAKFTVAAGAASYFLVTVPSTATINTAFTVTVVAKDQYGNTTNYSTILTPSSTGGAATLPASVTMTNGLATFKVTPTAAATDTISVFDINLLTGTSIAFTVAPKSAGRDN